MWEKIWRMFQWFVGGMIAVFLLQIVLVHNIYEMLIRNTV